MDTKPEWSEYCLYCGGKHEPDTDETWVEWQGVKRHRPFLCLCCGKETCARQFAYGRTCAICDTGICQRDPKYYHPPIQSSGDGVASERREMNRYDKLAQHFELLQQQYSALLQEIEGLRSQNKAELQVIKNISDERDALSKRLEVAMEAMNKSERLLDSNFGFRSQEDIDVWNILKDTLSEIAKTEDKDE